MSHVQIPSHYELSNETLLKQYLDMVDNIKRLTLLHRFAIDHGLSNEVLKRYSDNLLIAQSHLDDIKSIMDYRNLEVKTDIYFIAKKG